MTTRQQLNNVPAVGAAPRRVGTLLTSAIPGPDGDDHPNWRRGVVTWPEAAPGWRTVADCDPHEVRYGWDDGGRDPVGARPFLIQTRATLQVPLDVLRDRVTRQLDALSSAAVARELWAGDLTAAAPWRLPDGTPYGLANPRPDTGTALDGPYLSPHLTAADMLPPQTHPAAAVGAVEAAAGDLLAGGPVYVHVPAALLLELTQFGIAAADDGVLRTPLGSVLVADPGYPGTGPDPTGGEVVYATGPVQVWLDDPVVHDAPAEVVRHHNNHLEMHAERLALALFDPQTLVGCAITSA